MTQEEITKIAAIMCTADCDCDACAGQLLKQLIESYPKYEQRIKEVYEANFMTDYDEDIEDDEKR